MEQYLDLVARILRDGKIKDNRTGTPAISLYGLVFEHDMSDGFPLLTTKQVAYKMVRSELEFFIKGITDKRWLQERGNTIWNEWARRDKIPYALDAETKKRMLEERDLGPIYGWH